MALIAQYKLDGDGTDATGNGYNLTAANMTWGTGKIGQCGIFNGTSSTLTSPTNLNVVGATGFTVSAWVYVNALRNYDQGICKTAYNLPSPFDFYIDGTGTAGFIAGSGSNTTSGIGYQVHTLSGFTGATWQFITMVYTISGNTMALYRNGVGTSRAGPSLGVADNNKALILGTRADMLSRWAGKMDDVRLYNNSMTASEVLALYRSYSNTVRICAGNGLNPRFGGRRFAL